MVGGTTLGYCAMGSRKSATPPISTKTIASTLARTGRSMKNLEIMPRAPARSRLEVGRRRRLDLGLLRGDLPPRDGALRIGDHDPVVLRKPLGDRAQASEELTDLDIALLDLVILVDHQEISAELTGADRGVWHQKRFPRLPDQRHPDTGEEAGNEPAILVVEDAAHQQRASRGIDLRCRIVEVALMRVALLDRQTDLAGDLVNILERQVPLGHVGPDPEDVLLAHVERHPNRIDLDDGREL